MAKEKKEKPKVMASKCLLLKTPDKRCFFTSENNFPMLVEFGRTFGAEISVIRAKQEVEVMELADLAKLICSPPSVTPPEYEVLEIKLAAPTNENRITRQDRLKTAREINAHIHAMLLSGKTITLSDLESKFPFLTMRSLSNHLARAKRELQAQGYTIKREKPGQYRITYDKPDYNEAK